AGGTAAMPTAPRSPSSGSEPRRTVAGSGAVSEGVSRYRLAPSSSWRPCRSDGGRRRLGAVEDTLVPAVFPRRVHEPLHDLRLGPRRNLARPRQNEVRGPSRGF